MLILLWFLFFCSSPVPLFLGNEIVALMQQEAVGRREDCLGEEFLLLFPAEVQSQGRACTGSVTWAPAPCPILLPQSLAAPWGMAFLECPARVLKANPGHWLQIGLCWQQFLISIFFFPFFSLFSPGWALLGAPMACDRQCHGHHHCWDLAEVPATPSGICSHSLLPFWERRWWCAGSFPLSGPRRCPWVKKL